MFIRKNRAYFLLSGIMVFFSIQAAIAKPILNIQQWQTTNGIPVYFVESPGLPILDIRLAFDAGSARDETIPGLAQITNMMFAEATSTDNADTIAAKFDEAGAIFVNHVDRDSAIVALRTLTQPDAMKKALDTFQAVLTDPVFPEENLARIKNQVLRSLEEDKQDPAQTAADRFYQLVYEASPYAHPVSGNAETVEKINTFQVKQFHDRYYAASNAVMVMVGDLSTSDAQQIAQTLSQHLPQGRPAKALALSTPQKKALREVLPFPSSQTTIMVGQVGINRQDKDYFSLYVGNYILGGGDFASRLFETVRVKNGLAYGIYSYFLPLSAKGPFVIALQSRNQKASEALSITQTVLSDFVKKGPTSAELTAAKNNILRSFVLRLNSNDAIANQLVVMAFYHLPLNYLDTFASKVNAVSVSSIQQAFANTLDPAAMTTVLVGQTQ
ncbi:MAG: non-proteolytic protein peptidase family [Gammaproteobacteria bacterium]|jgi:zinc protease|nr:non-proteolytic protein peptidase family [Gammaproteobacteria bacterium]